MEIIRIKKNQIKIILILSAGVLFGELCFNMFLNPDKYISFVLRNSLFVKFFGLFAAILTFISVILIVIKNIRNYYGLIITEEGIIDNSSVGSIGLIKWKDIKEIRESKVMSTKILLIEVINPNDYLDNAKNKFTRSLLKSNFKMYRTPIVISSVALKCNFNELKIILNDNFKLYLKNESR